MRFLYLFAHLFHVAAEIKLAFWSFFSFSKSCLVLPKHDAVTGYKTMKFLSSFIVFAFSIFLVGQSHAQSSWGTQDTSINWIGFNLSLIHI